jgi:hypothetical protein
MMTIFYTVSRESDKPIYYAETCKSFSYFLFSSDLVISMNLLIVKIYSIKYQASQARYVAYYELKEAYLKFISISMLQDCYFQPYQFGSDI